MAWERLLARPTADRRIPIEMRLGESANGFVLEMTDGAGHCGRAAVAHAHQRANDAGKADATIREHLGKLGNTIFHVGTIDIAFSEPWFVPASVANGLRRDAVAALEAARAAALDRLPRAAPVSAHLPIMAISLSLKDGSSLYFWIPTFFSMYQGGITPRWGPIEVRCLIVRAQGRTSS